MIRLSILSVVLAGTLTSGFVHAQGRGATAAQARAYIYGAFLTQAAPGILADGVRLGPELEQRLKLPAGADSGKVYEALIALTDGKTLDVRRSTDDEVAGYGWDRPPDAQLLLGAEIFALRTVSLGE